MATLRILKSFALATATTVAVLSCSHMGLAATDVGRTAADFLLIGHGARAAAMGGAYTALASGPTAAYWNPAGLNGLEQTGISLGHFSSTKH